MAVVLQGRMASFSRRCVTSLAAPNRPTRGPFSPFYRRCTTVSENAALLQQLDRLRNLDDDQVDVLLQETEIRTALGVFKKHIRVVADDLDQDVASTVPAPTRKQLSLYFRDSFVPFVFFGFLDNSLMLLFGDFFDAHLGAMFGISTLTAAAMGNVIGDCCGIWLTGTVEAAVGFLGLKHHGMSLVQTRMAKTQTVKTLGMTCGIFVGCILGMFPLLWPKDLRLWENRTGLERKPSGELPQYQ